MIVENTAHAPESGGGATGYITHHLHHLQWQIGEGKFMTINLDSVFFTLIDGLVLNFQVPCDVSAIAACVPPW